MPENIKPTKVDFAPGEGERLFTGKNKEAWVDAAKSLLNALYYQAMKDVERGREEIPLREELYEPVLTFISEALASQKASLIEEIEKIVNRYSEATEGVEGGKRYLVDADGNRLPFGYPYPDTKEKYIVRDLLTLLSTGKGDKQ